MTKLSLEKEAVVTSCWALLVTFGLDQNGKPFERF